LILYVENGAKTFKVVFLLSLDQPVIKMKVLYIKYLMFNTYSLISVALRQLQHNFTTIPHLVSKILPPPTTDGLVV
jgi:hypothetical protein